MNTAGEALASEGCSSLGEFVLDCLKDCTAKQKPPSAVYLVRELVSSLRTDTHGLLWPACASVLVRRSLVRFVVHDQIMAFNLQAESVPSFADAAPSPHGTIAFSRKASLLAADLYLRFRSENAQLFDFCDMAALPADSGAYALAQLRARGAVECGQACASSIASGEEVSSGARERALRCAAVLAGKGVAAEVGVQPWQLCRWLQQQLDRRADADLVVHSNRATDAY